MSTNACKGAETLKIKRANSSISVSLERQEMEFGENEMAAKAGLCVKYYRQKKNRSPDTFTLRQLRTLLDKAADSEILAMFGRGEMIERMGR